MYLNVVYNDSGDDDNKGLRIWVLHHLVLTVCSLFVQHKLSSQKGRRHLERFSRKYIEVCPIIVTEQRCRTPDLVSEKVWLCLTKVSPTNIFLRNFGTTSAKFTTKELLKVKCFKTDISSHRQSIQATSQHLHCSSPGPVPHFSSWCHLSPGKRGCSAVGRMERQLREDRRSNWMAGLRCPGSARGGRCHPLLWFAFPGNLIQYSHIYLSQIS